MPHSFKVSTAHLNLDRLLKQFDHFNALMHSTTSELDCAENCLTKHKHISSDLEKVENQLREIKVCTSLLNLD